MVFAMIFGFLQKLGRVVAATILKILKSILPEKIFKGLLPEELLPLVEGSTKPPRKDDSPASVLQGILKILKFILPKSIVSLLPDALVKDTPGRSSSETHERSSEEPPPPSDFLYSILKLKKKVIRESVVSVLKILRFILPKKIFYGLLPDELLPLLGDTNNPNTRLPDSDEYVSIGNKSH